MILMPIHAASGLFLTSFLPRQLFVVFQIYHFKTTGNTEFKHVIFEESIVIEISIYIWRGSSYLITLVLAVDIGEIRGRCMPVR